MNAFARSAPLPRIALFDMDRDAHDSTSCVILWKERMPASRRELARAAFVRLVPGEKQTMEINGIGYLHGAQPIHGPHRASAPQPTPQSDAWMGVDELDISHEADVVSRVREMPDIRADRVAEIRAEIASGVYETDDKLDIAVGRLLDEIG